MAAISLGGPRTRPVRIASITGHETGGWLSLPVPMIG